MGTWPIMTARLDPTANKVWPEGQKQDGKLCAKQGKPDIK